MKKFALLSLLVLAAWRCPPAAAATPRRSRSPPTPPGRHSRYVDETTKQIVGFDIDLLEAIAKEGGLEVEFVNVGCDPLLAGMAECQYDAAISAMTITEDAPSQQWPSPIRTSPPARW